MLREGEEICLIGVGTMTTHALEAAALLDLEGIHVGVINARFVKPLDRALIFEAAVRYSCLVTIEDNTLAGGFGAAVMETLAARDVRTAAGGEARVIALGIPDRFIEHGSPASLYHQCGLSPEAIAARVRGALGETARVHVLSDAEHAPAVDG